MSYSNCVNIHGYCSSWKYIHIFTPIDVGVFFFFSKCVKLLLSSILEDYNKSDVVALTHLYIYKGILKNTQYIYIYISFIFIDTIELFFIIRSNTPTSF